MAQAQVMFTPMPGNSLHVVAFWPVVRRGGLLLGDDFVRDHRISRVAPRRLCTPHGSARIARLLIVLCACSQNWFAVSHDVQLFVRTHNLTLDSFNGCHKRLIEAKKRELCVWYIRKPKDAPRYRGAE